ncbi:MAG: hypothetical protein DRJ64_04050 [Thermoprotei archaeon]|nr:MAG: hypothetical protein DRJ64_04050 [Thermoprotei archaeon]
MSNQTLENAERQIEISIEQAQGAVNKKDMMNKLIATKEFNELFTIGYMESESARLVSLLSDDEWQTEDKQKELLNDMRSISSLRQYIMGVRSFGFQMERQITASRSQLSEMEEEAEGE